MNKWITGLFVAALATGSAIADVGAPAPSAKDLTKQVEKVNFVECDIPGVKLNGYVDVGYIYNFTGGGTIGTRFGRDGTKSGDFNVNAVKLTLEKPLTDKNELQAGFRVDGMLGEDAQAFAGSNGGAGAGNASNLLLEQAYVVVRAPWGNGVDFKLGKQVTWLGYEVIERPSNLNITYGNLFQNAIPLYGTGFSAETKFTDLLDGGIKIVNGDGSRSDSNTGFGTNQLGLNEGKNDGYAIEAKLNLKNKGGNANWQNSIYYTWDSSGNFANGNTAPTSSNPPSVINGNENGSALIWDSWGNWAPKFANDKLLLGFNTDLGVSTVNQSASSFSTTAGNLNNINRDSTWFGVAGYAKYKFTDIFSLAARGDYLHGSDPAKFATYAQTNSLQNAGRNQDLWSGTLTAAFDVVENLVIRAEYRFDVANNVSSNNGYETKSNTDDVAHTVAVQAVYTF